MLGNGYPAITQEANFKRIMSDKKNCLGFLDILLEELKLKSIKEIVVGDTASGKKDFNWNQLNILACDRSGDVYNIKLNVFNDKARFTQYMKGTNDVTWQPVAADLPIKTTYIVNFCTFDPYGLGNTTYELSIREVENNEVNVHIKTINGAGGRI